MTEWLTPKEAAAKLKVSEQLIRSMYHAKKLRGMRIGKLIRIDADSLGMDTTARPKRQRVVKDYIGDVK